MNGVRNPKGPTPETPERTTPARPATIIYRLSGRIADESVAAWDGSAGT